MIYVCMMPLETGCSASGNEKRCFVDTLKKLALFDEYQ